MTEQDYIKLSEALAVQTNFVAERATEIVREIVKENADDDGHLWLGAVDYIWFYGDKKRLLGLSINECGQMFYSIPDDVEEALEGFFSDLSTTDKIKIADYLVEHF